MIQKPSSKKPDALQKLRQIIREEVKSAVKDEIVPILLEVIKSRSLTENTAPNYRNTIQSQVTTPPNTVNTSTPNNSKVHSILEETRQQMLAEARMPGTSEYQTLLSANTSHLPIHEHISGLSEADPSDQVNAMLSTAVKSTKEENVEITNVPDFSSLMKKMNL